MPFLNCFSHKQSHETSPGYLRVTFILRLKLHGCTKITSTGLRAVSSFNHLKYFIFFFEYLRCSPVRNYFFLRPLSVFSMFLFLNCLKKQFLNIKSSFLIADFEIDLLGFSRKVNCLIYSYKMI